MSILKCKHNWEITERSNVLQQDDMGYPLRLFICKCSKCGKSEQQWRDVDVAELEELKTHNSVLLERDKVDEDIECDGRCLNCDYYDTEECPDRK